MALFLAGCGDKSGGIGECGVKSAYAFEIAGTCEGVCTSDCKGLEVDVTRTST